MKRALRAALLVGTLVAPVAAAPAPPAPVTCADVGVLLARTYASYDELMLAKHETEIAKACTAAAWPQPVLECIGSTITEAGKCIEQLPHDAQVALVSSVTIAQPPEAAKPAGGPGVDDAEQYTSCEDAIAAPAAFGGAPEGTSDDIAFSLALRKHELVDACNDDGWPEHAKECFAKAQDQDHVLTCVKKLPDEAQTHAVSAVVAELELSQKTFELRKTAASVTCAKVVAKHYGDVAWKDRLTKNKPGDKKAAIAASRSAMTKACTAEKWTPTVRACVIAGGEMAECAQTPGRDPWGFPAYGVLVPTGVAACDKYLAGLTKLAACPGAKDMRDALLGMVSSAESTLAEMPDESRKVIGESCEQGMSQLADQFKQLSCKP